MTTQSAAFAHGDAFFAECNLVNGFIDTSVRPIVERTLDKTSPEHLTYLGALLRVSAWLRSLAKLNHPGDFQAVVSGSRALFEIAVDLALLQFDSATHSHEMILAWEQSAKLKHAEGVERFYRKAGKQVPSDFQEVSNFVARQGPAIQSQRVRLWPHKNGKHPERWTGHDLRHDASQADKAAPYGFVSGLNANSFEEFYTKRFAHLCWNTHGSGLAGVRFVPEDDFPAVSALGFAESAQLAFLCADLLLRLFGKHDAITEARFAALKQDRLKARAKVLSAYPPVSW